MATEIERSSGNIFADIGIRDPETHQLKVQVAILIEKVIESRELSQRDAADQMGASQADVSHIVRGIVRGISLERLIRCARALGVEVNLRSSVIADKPEGSAHDVAAHILNRLGRISAKMLQKLVYYSQAWHLAWYQRPLFPERIEAWQQGPVVKDLFKIHGGAYSVHPPWPGGDPERLSVAARDAIDAVIERYRHFTPDALGVLTHRESPWLDARGDLPPNVRSSHEITHEAMAEFYRSQE